MSCALRRINVAVALLGGHSHSRASEPCQDCMICQHNLGRFLVSEKTSVPFPFFFFRLFFWNEQNVNPCRKPVFDHNVQPPNPHANKIAASVTTGDPTGAMVATLQWQ